MGRGGFHEALAETPVRHGTAARGNPVAVAVAEVARRHRERGASLATLRRELIRLYLDTDRYFQERIAALDAELAETRQAERDAWADQAGGNGW